MTQKLKKKNKKKNALLMKTRKSKKCTFFRPASVKQLEVELDLKTKIDSNYKFVQEKKPTSTIVFPSEMAMLIGK